MEDISYNQSKLSEIASNFEKATTEADSIKGEITSSISIIKENWLGSDDVIAQRDIDFKSILDNMEVICNNLNATTRYLGEKNDSFAAASTSYRSGQ